MIKIKILTTLLLTIAATSCNLEPKYKTPTTKLPLTITNQKQTTWQNFFKSKDLQKIIQLALDNNQDLKIANLNIQKAQATNNIAKSNLLPSINATSSVTRQGVPGSLSSFTPQTQYRAGLSISAYELDFFGRLKNLNKSALEDFLATKEARDITQISLIAQTANSYADFLSDSKILKISSLIIRAQQVKHNFVKSRYENGISSKSELLEALSLLENSKMIHQNYKKIVQQDKNRLMLLTGVFNEELLPLKSSLENIEMNESLLNFTPSKTLLSRPDIKKAEHLLKSANANIGAARAAFFPSISLTGSYGYGSQDLSNLFSSRTWSFTPQINIPIFTAGRNIAKLKISKIRKKIEIINYEKAIQTAFTETLDGLATRKSAENRLKSAESILKAQQDSYNISQAKYEIGTGNISIVMDSGLSLLLAEKDQVASERDYIVNLISLYKILGGES